MGGASVTLAKVARRPTGVLSSAVVLGAPIGGAGVAATLMAGATVKVENLHLCMGELDDPATEFVLTRKCADVAKIM